MLRPCEARKPVTACTMPGRSGHEIVRIHSESATCVEEAVDAERARAKGVVLIGRTTWPFWLEEAAMLGSMMLGRMEVERASVVTSVRVSCGRSFCGSRNRDLEAICIETFHPEPACACETWKANNVIGLLAVIMLLTFWTYFGRSSSGDSEL